jgi:hypothetical protein
MKRHRRLHTYRMKQNKRLHNVIPFLLKLEQEIKAWRALDGSGALPRPAAEAAAGSGRRGALDAIAERESEHGSEYDSGSATGADGTPGRGATQRLPPRARVGARHPLQGLGLGLEDRVGGGVPEAAPAVTATSGFRKPSHAPPPDLGSDGHAPEMPVAPAPARSGKRKWRLAPAPKKKDFFRRRHNTTDVLSGSDEGRDAGEERRNRAAEFVLLSLRNLSSLAPEEESSMGDSRTLRVPCMSQSESVTVAKLQYWGITHTQRRVHAPPESSRPLRMTTHSTAAATKSRRTILEMGCYVLPSKPASITFCQG